MTALLVLAAAAAALGVLILASMRWPILMALAVLFSMSLDYVGKLGLGVLTANNLIKSLFLLIFALRLLMEPRPLRLPSHLLWFLPLAIVAGAGVFHSQNFETALLGSARLIFVWSFAVLLANVVQEERHFRWVGHALALAVLLTAVMAIIQAMQIFRAGPLAIHGAEQAVARGVRVSGSFWNPNRMAVHLAGALILLFAMLPDLGKSRLLKAFYLLVMTAGFLAVMLSLSRSGYISVALGLVLFAFSRRHRPAAFSLMVSGALVLAGVLIFSPYGKDLAGRFASFTELGQDVSGQARVHLILSGLNIFADGPNFLWGAGFASFPAALESHLHYLMSHDVYYHSGIRASHNLWVKIAAELGLFGLAAIALFFRAVYRNLSLLLREQEQGLRRSLTIGLLVYVTVKVVDFNFNPEFEENLFWYAMGLLGALGSFPSPGPNRNDSPT